MARFILLVFFFLLLRQGWAQSLNLDTLIKHIVEAPDTAEYAKSALTNEYQRLSQAELLRDVKRRAKFLESVEGKGKVVVLQMLGGLCWDKQLFTEALSFYNESIETAVDDGNLMDAAQGHLALAERFRVNEMYVEALERVYKAREIFHTLNNLYWQARCYSMAANIAFRAGNYNLCAEEVSKSLAIYRLLDYSSFTSGDSTELMSTYNTAGLAYAQLKDFRKAMASFAAAEQIAVATNNTFWIGLINGNKSDIFYEQGEYDKAIAALKFDFRESLHQREWASAISAALQLSRVNMKKNDWGRAAHYLDTAKVLMDTHSTRVKSAKANYWDALANLEAHRGNFKAAYDALGMFKLIHDSIDIERRAINLARVKTAHEIQLKQAQIELLTAENKLRAEQVFNRNVIVASILGSLFLLVGWLFTMYRSVQTKKKDNLRLAEQNDEINSINEELKSYSETLAQQNLTIQKMNDDLEFQVDKRTRELQEANAELDTFLYRASHDIRRPITSLLGLAHLSRFANTEQERKELFDKVVNTAATMDNMLTKLQKVYELNHPEPERYQISIRLAVSNAFAKFSRQLEKAGMAHSFRMDNSVSFETDENMLNVILHNLIENAIVFRKIAGPDKPHVWIDVEQLGNQVVLKCRDNGIGIENKYLDNIFESHFRGTELSTGIGLGLYLVKRAAAALRGRVEVFSEYGVGTTFIVYLPVR